jgi:hypothetical protein
MDIHNHPFNQPERAGVLVLDDPKGPVVFEGYLWGAL